MMRDLSIDIETYSPADLASVGAYRYSEDPGFRVLLFGYAFDDGPVEVVDMVHGDLPGEVGAALVDPDVVKHAYNAAFERVCLSRLVYGPEHPGLFLDPSQWRCTMVQAAYWGAPGSLRQVTMALDMAERKDAAGTRLINRFSKPAKDGSEPDWSGEDWDLFVGYNRQDVETERNLSRSLPGPIPDGEQELYAVDQRVNDRGAGIDRVLAHEARAMAEADAARARERLEEVTGLDNPNSATQLRRWICDRGCEVESVGRQVLEGLLAQDVPPEVREAVELRLASAKSSVKKYAVAEEAACADGRIRGCFQFYGAQTGRWAGRLMQLQNLPRGELHGRDLDFARELVRSGDAEGAEAMFGDVQDTLKSLVRTVIVPSPGKTIAVADYSAIEARVVAWLAGEADVLEIFRTTGKIYEGTASRVFGVPIGQVDKSLRQRGKVATLALGYGGGPAALVRMGALELGIEESELPKMVRMWRNSNRRIVALWGAVEQAAREALLHGGTRRAGNGLSARRERRIGGIALDLPSGRSLHYRQMRVGADGSLSYSLSGKGAGVIRVETWGGRLVENATQAVARDLLACALQLLDELGYGVVAHVHDEVLVEVPEDEGGKGLADIIALMCAAPSWAAGLPLAADGYTCASYRKE